MIPIIKKSGNMEKNKTGKWTNIKPVRDPKKCIKCGLCWQYCPEGCINKNFDSDYDYCKGCGICAETCPVKAIKMVKK